MNTPKVLVALAIVVLAAVAGFVYSGAYNMAADEPHWPVTYDLLATLRERSVAARIGDIEVPADLADSARVQRGAGNYDAMCAGCHLRPGIHSSEIRKGLYPQPPDLSQAIPGREPSEATTERAAARQFWIIKHGVKASGMPAWSRGGVDDGTIWDMVALLRKLPTLDGTDYAAMVAASEGHTHAGAGGEHDQGGGHGKETAAPDHKDAPGSPPHGHGEKKEPEGHNHDH